MKKHAWSAAVLALCLAPWAAVAQDNYPAAAIKVIVPYPPGA
jgi:tripartite-type tricarboxylate transporter receptor subunit TctC